MQKGLAALSRRRITLLLKEAPQNDGRKRATILRCTIFSVNLELWVCDTLRFVASFSRQKGLIRDSNQESRLGPQFFFGRVPRIWNDFFVFVE